MRVILTGQRMRTCLYWPTRLDAIAALCCCTDGRLGCRAIRRFRGLGLGLLRWAVWQPERSSGLLTLASSKTWAAAWPVDVTVPHPDDHVEDPEQRYAWGEFGLPVEIFQSEQDGRSLSTEQVI